MTEDELLARLDALADSSSEMQSQMAVAKSLRQTDNPEGRDDLYSWPWPAETIEGLAAAHIRAQSAEVVALKAENGRLSAHVMSEILPDLLNEQETDELVKFVKFLREENFRTALKGPDT